jgi:hypothetical protein
MLMCSSGLLNFLLAFITKVEIILLLFPLLQYNVNALRAGVFLCLLTYL